TQTSVVTIAAVQDVVLVRRAGEPRIDASIVFEEVVATQAVEDVVALVALDEVTRVAVVRVVVVRTRQRVVSIVRVGGVRGGAVKDLRLLLFEPRPGARTAVQRDRVVALLAEDVEALLPVANVRERDIGVVVAVPVDGAITVRVVSVRGVVVTNDDAVVPG